MEGLLVHGQTCLRHPRWVHLKITSERGQKLPLRRPKTGRRQQQLVALPRSTGRRVVAAGMASKLKEKDGGAVATVEETVPASAYRDGWFDQLAIRHLTQSIQTTTGVRTSKEGYEGLIEAASMVAKQFDHKGQQELVIESLNMAFPSPLMALIRTLMLPSKFTREYFAFFTTLFFSWLIGPCEVKESVLNGRLEKNVVHIKKCRFLEGTNCVGMCTNMCKIPSQDFIKNSLGIPLYMAPNFEDMSCEMFFGQSPPAAADDPALAQPCHHFSCKVKQAHGVDCSSI